MNWIRENKFLTGFLVVLVIGAGVLGYLLYSAYGAYADVTDQYTAAANELGQLQKRVPYPDHANLVKYQAERDDLKDATHSLASSLSQMVLPIDALTPSAFQDRLRDTVTTIVDHAGKTGVLLPKDFALDFATYQTQPPVAAAAGPLGRQLAALQIATNILIDDHVDNISELTRTRLPQEGGAAAAPQERGGGAFGRRGGEGETSAPGGLVDKVSFDLKFTSSQPAFQKVLNDFAASNKQFFITRTLVVNNSDPKPVSKVAETAPGAAAAQPAVTGTDASGVSYLKFIVGTEKLNVAMRIDMVTFNPPDKSARKPAPAAPTPTAAPTPAAAPSPVVAASPAAVRASTPVASHSTPSAATPAASAAATHH
jgi:hypothetical protein